MADSRGWAGNSTIMIGRCNWARTGRLDPNGPGGMWSQRAPGLGTCRPPGRATTGRAVRGTIRYAGQAPRGGGSVRSTMMDLPLTITSIMRYGTSVFGDGEVVTWTGDGTRRRTYTEAGRRAARLANALRGLGVDSDQRVGTFMWNNAEHLEAYLAIPSMGAVLHTLNIRLAAADVGYIATHAEDQVVIVDASLVPKFAEILPSAPTVKHVIVTGGPPDEPPGPDQRTAVAANASKNLPPAKPDP